MAFFPSGNLVFFLRRDVKWHDGQRAAAHPRAGVGNDRPVRSLRTVVGRISAQSISA